MAKTKVTDAEFLSFLRENRGLLSQTARAIEAYIGQPYSRMAVRDRAKKFEKEMEDIAQEGLDVAEEGLDTIMREGRPDLKLKAIELFLKSKGAARGFGNKMDITSNGKSIAPIDWVK